MSAEETESNLSHLGHQEHKNRLGVFKIQSFSVLGHQEHQDKNKRKTKNRLEYSKYNLFHIWELGHQEHKGRRKGKQKK